MFNADNNKCIRVLSAQRRVPYQDDTEGPQVPLVDRHSKDTLPISVTFKSIVGNIYFNARYFNYAKKSMHFRIIIDCRYKCSQGSDES